MQLKKLIWAVSALVLMAALTSCNIGKSPEPTPDVNAIFTSAAGTMVAQLNDQQTQTALAVPPTPLSSPTPLSTFTPQPTFSQGSTPFGTPFIFNTPGLGVTPLAPTSGVVVSGFAVGCNNATFMIDKPIDKTVLKPAKQFDKIWELMNSGTCAWDQGYSFRFKSGERLQGEDIIINLKDEFTQPGHSQTFIVPMWTPGNAGEYIGYWQMKGDDGQWFGSLVSVDIIVHR
jgi:hypothetical protein